MTTPFEIDTGRLVVPVTGDDHSMGPESAPVTLVEYGDFQCPYCGRAYPIVQQLMAERADTVRLVFRNFPLTDLHPMAEVAAEFAEAAGAREQFWPAHDWLYEHQRDIEPVRLASLGNDLDPSGGIAKDLANGAFDNEIRQDFIGGIRSGVNGTPSFFINGVRHDGGYTLPELLDAVDAAASAR